MTERFRGTVEGDSDQFAYSHDHEVLPPVDCQEIEAFFVGLNVKTWSIATAKITEKYGSPAYQEWLVWRNRR